MDLRRQYYLQAIGIQRWVSRQSADAAAGQEEPSPTPTAPAHSGPGAMMDWEELEERVSVCTACALHAGRKHTVFGAGNRIADWMIIGEAPGAEEDAQGEPFVGRAGKLLNNMLKAIGLERDQVFIGNILKCRPPNNRDPQPEEVKQCNAYLQRQIELIQPKIVLAVGRIAAQNLLHTEQTIGRLRGVVHNLPDHNIPLVVTYHPAYLLRKPTEKRKSWQDLILAYNAWKAGH